ncbi:hypothetical protein BV898_13275 [Hypsibius exemplaris]|uniref:Uncharacterized protein n=1 Tax=Hypsibius exemplaris TaxID=2072580 RepID=A0A1W0WB78_HYPEX|nr:hypothetical protein BV898_13275 [Hypsibius exemplaris]
MEKVASTSTGRKMEIPFSSRSMDTSVSSYAACPPARYKRPLDLELQLPKGAGTFDQLLSELNQQMDQLKLKIAGPAEIRLTTTTNQNRYHDIGNVMADRGLTGNKKISGDMESGVQERFNIGRTGAGKMCRSGLKASQSSNLPSKTCRSKLATLSIGTSGVEALARHTRTASEPPPSGSRRGERAHRRPCRGYNMPEMVRRQVREASSRLRRIESARTFSVQRGRDRRRRLKLKACSAPGHPTTVCSALHKLQHYHVDMKNLPFMPSNPSGPSFNLKANVQQVIGKLKTHHPDLCESRKGGRKPSSLPAAPAGSQTYRVVKKKTSAGDALEELEREYARTYRKYERVKLDIIAVQSQAHLRHLLGKKTMIKERLRNLQQRMEYSRAKAFEPREGLCARFQARELNSRQNLLRDLRDVQNLFENCNV